LEEQSFEEEPPMNTNRFIIDATAALLMLCLPVGQVVVAQPSREAGPQERPLPQTPLPVPPTRPAERAQVFQSGPEERQGGAASRPGIAFAPATMATVAPGAPPAANVDLADLVSRVGAATGKRIFLDSRTPSRIYVSGSALDDPTYPLFLVALDANGLAAAEVEGSVLVVPVDEARQLPSRIVQSDDQNVPDDEWVTRIVTVKGDTAARLVPVLRPMLPRAAHLAAFLGGDGATESKLIIVDRYANVQRITQLVEALTQ
jgi:type II secretory pathway component GspD/PulD (secretin)